LLMSLTICVSLFLIEHTNIKIMGKRKNTAMAVNNK